MGVDVDALKSEVESIATALDVGWADFAIYCKAKWMESRLNGTGIANYMVNGRSVAHDTKWWSDSLTYAQLQASIEESGGVDQQPITFASRT